MAIKKTAAKSKIANLNAQEDCCKKCDSKIAELQKKCNELSASLASLEKKLSEINQAAPAADPRVGRLISVLKDTLPKFQRKW